MEANASFPKGSIPDMFLYHRDQTHYDLLVSEDHRLALLGLIGEKSKKHTNQDDDSQLQKDETWQNVSYNKKKQVDPEKILEDKKQVDPEKLVEDSVLIDDCDMDLAASLLQIRIMAVKFVIKAL